MAVNIPILGVSKRCCPVCRSILQALHPGLGEPLGNLDSHPQVFPSAFPPGLPGVVTERVVEEYRCLLESELQQLTPCRSMFLGECGKLIDQALNRGCAEYFPRGLLEKQG